MNEELEKLKAERQFAEQRYHAAQLDNDFGLMDMIADTIDSIDERIEKARKEEKDAEKSKTV